MAPILNAEALSHRDLNRRHVVATPDRLKNRVAESQIEDLAETHLPQKVVDPIELRLIDVLVDLVRQLPRRLQVMAERLLDHDTRVLGQAGIMQTLDHPPEQERRDLEVEHRTPRIAHRLGDALVGVTSRRSRR